MTPPRGDDSAGFHARLAAFKRTDERNAPVKSSKLGSEDIAKATLKNKCAAFEKATGQKPPAQMKKEWKVKPGGGGYVQEKVFVGGDGKKLGAAPKKRLSELLAG